MSDPDLNPYAAPVVNDSGGEVAGFSPVGVKASRGLRLGARVIDWLVLGLAMLPGTGLIAMLSATESSGGPLFGAIGMLFAFPFAVACYNWVLIVRSGQTIGKRALGIRVLRQDGSPVDFVYGVLLREWVPVGIGQVVPFAGLIDAALIFTEDRRCVHDLLASTDVFVAPGQDPRQP